jgi:hypothetical protein
MVVEMQPETLKFPFWPEGGGLDGLCVVLDAAGGGGPSLSPESTKAPTTTSLTAADRAVHIAAQVRHHFIRSDASVPMVRWDDRPVALLETPEADAAARAAWAHNNKAHLFLSIEDAPPGKAHFHAPVGDDLSIKVAEALAAAFDGEAAVHFSDSPLFRALDGVPAVVARLPRDPERDTDIIAASDGSHRSLAIALHAGLCRVWKSLREQLEERRQGNFPNAPAVKVTPTVPAQVIAGILWKRDRPPADANEANHLLDLLRRAQISDRTIQRFDVRARQVGDGWVVEGGVSHQRLKEAAEGLLRAVRCPNVQNKIELLPSARLGALRFGIVRVPMAMTWLYPQEGNTVQTQLRLGECLFLLDKTEDGAWYLIQGEDGYIGWVRADAVLPMDASAFDAWRSRPRAHVLRDAVVGSFRIPTGARLPILDRRPLRHALLLELPPWEDPNAPGIHLELPTPNAVPEVSKGFGELAAELAMGLLGTPYSFGARTTLGLDCSGLSATVWSAAGLVLPRDAFQQALMGRLVATPWHRTGMQRGDLLFFIDNAGRTFHVAVSLGGQRFVHSSPPEVHVCSLDPADPLYRKRWEDDFLFARRPIG